MRQGEALSYIWVFAVGITIIYSFSMLPRATGFATGLPEACTGYFGDAVCDDSREDCGPDYIKGVSLAFCDECQTGGFDCAYRK